MSYAFMNILKFPWKAFMLKAFMQLTTETAIHFIAEQNIAAKTQKKMYVNMYTFRFSSNSPVLRKVGIYLLSFKKMAHHFLHNILFIWNGQKDEKEYSFLKRRNNCFNIGDKMTCFN